MRRLLYHKVPAFSLIEMLVVLILSSIVATILYMVYYTVTTYQINLANRYKAVDDASALYFLLKKDTERSSRVVAVDAYSLIYYLNDAPRTVEYSFIDGVCLRKQNELADTLKGIAGAPVLRWRGQDIADYPAVIDELFVPRTDTTAGIHIYKRYDAAALLRVQSDSLTHQNDSTERIDNERYK